VSRSALDPRGEGAHSIADLWWIMLVAAILVFAIVTTLLVVAVLRRRGAQDGPVAAQAGSHRVVLLLGAWVPAVVLLALFVLVLASMPTTAAGDGEGEPELTIEVTGRQWFWDVRYRESRVRTSNELHLPVGVPVRMRVRSADVIHSLWMPSLDRKIDAFPDRWNEIVVEADEPGRYAGECAEFCGRQHARMNLLVVAQAPAEFEEWLAGQAKPGATPISASAREGQQVFLGSCVYCHRIGGTNATGTVGPDLTHLASRGYIGAGRLTNTRANLAGWILDSQQLKPGNRMPAMDLSGDELQPLLDYLETLK
jgi:cytochrome c oxidase subunit 2